jgi:hypothetical protein
LKKVVLIAPKGHENYDCELEMSFTLEGSKNFVEFAEQYLSNEKKNLEVLLIHTWIDADLSIKGVSIVEQELHGNTVRLELPYLMWKFLTGTGKECMHQRLLDIVEMREKDWE